jgi:hypothetical protein
MLALKRAYAEIILNTAKEAAARVMASERKASSFQQDLRATKDEALRMLLRLKQMIDSKVRNFHLMSFDFNRLAFCFFKSLVLGRSLSVTLIPR